MTKDITADFSFTDGSAVNGQSAYKALGDAAFEAECQLEKEQQDLERSITDIVEVEVILCSLLSLMSSFLFATCWVLLNRVKNNLALHLQMKQIQEKIKHFEEVELQTEKEWLQLRHMKDLFFADQLAFLQHRARATPPEGGERGRTKTSDVT